MDQQSLYELQLGANRSPLAHLERALVVRNEFVLKFIKSHCFRDSRQCSVAELSIGDGALSELLVGMLPDVVLTCTDISPGRISYVKDRLHHYSSARVAAVHFIECNFDSEFHLLPSESYDFVIALDIMEHVFDVFNFVSNCNRTLRTNGFLILRVPNVAYIKHRAELLRGVLPITASWFGPRDSLRRWETQYGWDGGHLHFFTIPILIQLLEEKKFRVHCIKDPGTRFSRMRDLWPNLLYSNPMLIAQKLE